MSKARVNELWVCGFTAETPVLMADGKIKPISKVKEGEFVTSFDPKTKQYTTERVIGTLSDTYSDVLEIDVDGSKLLVAANQRFYTPEGDFKIAPDAKKIVTDDGREREFTFRKFKGGKVKMYDITVDRTHAFMANGLLVHNGGGGGGGHKQPAPPPDPVVTAGKVGKPVTITTNGNTITVPAQAGNSARVSVSYSGGVSTGYSAVPGTPAYPPPVYAQPPMTIVSPVPLASINYLTQALNQQTTTCSDLTSASDKNTKSERDAWAAQLASARSNVELARANDPYRFLSGGPFRGGGVAWIKWHNDPEYQQIISEFKELEKFVKKDKKYSDRDKRFISGKCDGLNARMSSIKARLDNSWMPGPFEPPCEPLPKPTPDRIYSDNPSYNYYNKVATINSCGYYYPSIPGVMEPMACFAGPDAIACRPPSAYYYKHFDTNVGKFYLDKNSANCV